ncbi:MAG: hypothetical protein ACK5PS_15785 [Desulfopila sp.]
MSLDFTLPQQMATLACHDLDAKSSIGKTRCLGTALKSFAVI